MKKAFLLLLSVLLCLFLSSCSVPSGVSPSVESDSSTSSSGSSVKEESEPDPLTDDRIKELVESNLNCMYNIFVLSSLPVQGEPLYDNVYQVDESKFSSYSAFESYVRNTYEKDEADRLLYNYPEEGRAKYLDKDGKLCVDMDLDSGKGYYVDWRNYTFEKISASPDRCDFILHALVEEPADKPVAEEYDVTVTVLYQDGKWLLEKMFY